MKGKISFTSVLKSKSGNRQLNGSSQYSIQSQHKQKRLIDIYEEFQSSPNQQYTLNLNASRNISRHSRNNSINMMKSKNVNEDPQMSRQSWMQKQKTQNVDSFTKFPVQNGFKAMFNKQQQNFINKRSKSNFNRNQMYSQQLNYEEQDNYNQSSNLLMQGSKGINQIKMDQSNKQQKRLQKSPIQYRAQINETQAEKTFKSKVQTQQKSKALTVEDIFAVEQIQSKSYYPDLDVEQYEKLELQFERLKNQKIYELCQLAKKSIQKEKLQEIISTALDNIYENIEQLAQKIVNQRKTLQLKDKKQIFHQQQISQQMLISGSNSENYNNAQKQQQENNSQQVSRKQQFGNIIKGYISGIQQAKSQGKNSTASLHEYKSLQKHQSLPFYQQKNSQKDSSIHQSQQPSFCNSNNMFNQQKNTNFSNKIESYQIYNQNQKNQNSIKYSTPLDSVGYSFSNNNMICEHSFNKDIMSNNQFQNELYHGEQMSFQKNKIQPPIYEPQNSDNQQQQKISLPNIEEVNSDCGDYRPEHSEIESSKEIQFKRNKMQNLTLDMTGKNIKNIESVHYEPPIQTLIHENYQSFSSNKDLFKHFEKPSYNFQQNKKCSIKSNNQSISQNLKLKEQYISNPQQQKFISKTFNSYLSGQMRSDYGKTVFEQQKQMNISNNGNNTFTYKTLEYVNEYSVNNKIINYEDKKPQQLSNSKLSPQLISSTRQTNLLLNNQSLSQQPSLMKMNNSNMNDSSQLSLNQSVCSQSNKIDGISPKNIHQLHSKNKLSINSPMTKIDEMISHQQKIQKQLNITDFNQTFQNTNKYQSSNNLHSSNSYAVSLPAGNYKIDSNLKQNTYNQNLHDTSNQRRFACAQSIVSNKMLIQQTPSVIQDSYIQKQICQSKQSKIQKPNLYQNQVVYQSYQNNSNSILSMQPLKLCDKNSEMTHKIRQSLKKSETFSQYLNKKLVQSVQNNMVVSDTPKIIYQNNSSNTSKGRTFLQSLHQKQSIEIDLSPQQNKINNSQKTSFVEQTFRPTLPTSNQPVMKSSKINLHLKNDSIPHNKISISKITLRSDDKNHITSPKVISLSINNLTQKNENAKQFATNSGENNKQNIFQNLTIKQIKNSQSDYETKTSTCQYIHQTNKVSQSSNHVDFSSKQNKNTSNNLHAVSINKPATIIEKHQPLLKLSKNMKNSTQQSNRDKKSVGQSIRTKMICGSIRQSVKGVKQSFGNDSDMDFDLELD